ncbi:DUF406 family protein [Shewanella carassii]|uniref:DUF406 family protein n=1 Tax=Shewanella carassii TaxID=1987584 RepID=A0ABQ1SYC5_9GAMM|nr:DUF406 family protein [Shewanella carassii]GGE66720.1 hypothetical protein GCM10011520_04370 [Shewanella carassii]
MKSIQQAQAANVHDTCAECGSYVDIGTVVEEGDTLLSLTFQGESATVDAETLKKLAEGRFADVKAELRRVEQTVTLALTFSCSAEKMIFQLENALA